MINTKEVREKSDMKEVDHHQDVWKITEVTVVAEIIDIKEDTWNKQFKHKELR